MTYDVEYPGPGMGEGQKCGGLDRLIEFQGRVLHSYINSHHDLGNPYLIVVQMITTNMFCL